MLKFTDEMLIQFRLFPVTELSTFFWSKVCVFVSHDLFLPYAALLWYLTPHCCTYFIPGSSGTVLALAMNSI